MKPRSMPQASPRSIFGSCTDPSNPSFIDLPLPSASLSWGCSGHAQMHCFNFCFFFKDSEKILGREHILRPLVILRQHALAYNRIIALGTDSAKTHSVFYNSTLTYLGAGRMKRKLSK